jgi:hypothetical protein
MSLKLNTASGGSITLQEADTASNLTITVPSETGTMITTASTFAGTGPAFSAYNTSSQSVSNNTFTKVTLQTEVFDTNNNFASSTFTPTVAGYYQINGLLRATGTSMTGAIAVLYKNGSVYTYGQAFDGVSISSAQLTVTEVIYMNGSTDYLELYGYITATSPAFGYAANHINCRFSGALVRVA